MPTVSQNNSLISVVMPVYNAENYVSAAIESVLAQTYSHLELIVVDDGSTDNSRMIAADFAQRDPRVRLLSTEHGGQSAALNTAVDEAQGTFIALMDADDLALPERLAVQMRFLEQTRTDVCGSCVQCFGNERRIFWFPEGHSAICSELLFRCALLPSTVLMRAAILKENRFLPGLTSQDYEMWTRIALRYQLGNVQQVLVQYRRHPDQISRQKKITVHREFADAQKRYFFEFYSDAGADDLAAFERLVKGKPYRTLAELKLAGALLLRAGDSTDLFFKKRMAERWLNACCRSAALGQSCWKLYQEIAPSFGALEPQARRKLWLLCAFRLGSASSAYRLAKQLFVSLHNHDYAAA